MSAPDNPAHPALSQEALEELRAQLEESVARSEAIISRIEQLLAERDAIKARLADYPEFPPFK